MKQIASAISSGCDQPAELRERQDVLGDVVDAHRPNHRRVGEAGVDDAAAHAVVHRLLHDRRRGALEAGLGARIGDLAAVALRRDRADEHHRALHALVGRPALQALGGAILGDAPDHLQRPVHGRDEVDVDDELELLERIDAGLARHLVDAHGQIVTGDARGRHAQRNAAVLAADRIEDRGAEPLVGRVALEGDRERAPGFGIELVGDVFDRLAHVDERHGGHVAPRHRGGHRAADAASAAGDDRNPVREIHKPSAARCCTAAF